MRLATHYLPSDRLEEAKERIIAQPFRTEAILDELSAEEVPDAPILGRLKQIDRLFASDRLEDILDALDAAAATATPGPRAKPRSSAGNRQWPARSA